MLLVLVLLVPKLVHVDEDAASNSRNTAAPVSNQEIDKRLREMVPLPPDFEPK